MTKEIHIILDNGLYEKPSDIPVLTTFNETYIAVEKEGREIVYTTQPHFLSFRYLPARLFVHVYGDVHEVKLGDTEGNARDLREGHNLEKLLIAGDFDWF